MPFLYPCHFSVFFSLLIFCFLLPYLFLRRYDWHTEKLYVFDVYILLSSNIVCTCETVTINSTINHHFKYNFLRTNIVTSLMKLVWKNYFVWKLQNVILKTWSLEFVKSGFNSWIWHLPLEWFWIIYLSYWSLFLS